MLFIDELVIVVGELRSVGLDGVVVVVHAIFVHLMQVQQPAQVQLLHRLL